MNRIRNLRKIKGINQIELSQLLNVSQQTISTYENGTRDPDVEAAKFLANYFNVSIDYLLGETNIEVRYEEASNFIDTIRDELNTAGYDFSEKSAKEISDIILLALLLVKKIKK